MSLRPTVIRPEVFGYAAFFEFLNLCFLVRYVKDAPLFSGRAVADVRFGL